MTVVFSQLFAALRRAGVPEELAEAAAAEPLDPILDLRKEMSELKVRMARVEVKLNVMLTLILAVLLIVLRDVFVS